MEKTKENEVMNKPLFSKWNSNKSVRTKIVTLLKEKMNNNDKTPTVILVGGVRLGGKSSFINELACEIRQVCLTNLITCNMMELSGMLVNNTDMYDQGFVFLAEEDTANATFDDQFIEVDYHLTKRGIEDVLCVIVEPSPIIIVHSLRKLEKFMGNDTMAYIWEDIVLFDHHFGKSAVSMFFDTVVKRTMKRFKRVARSGRVSVICLNSILYPYSNCNNPNKFK